MSEVTKSVEVDAPVSQVYNQWTQFETFPQFMEGVKEVRQLDDRRLHWVAEVAGKHEEWDAEIVDQVPDRHIEWRSTSGSRNDGRIEFESLGENRCRLNLRMNVEPEGFTESVGDALGLLDRRVKADLDRFCEFIEERGKETGAWRGEVGGSQASTTGTTGSFGQGGTTEGTERKY